MARTDGAEHFSWIRWLGLVPARNPDVDAVAHPEVQFEDSDISGRGIALAGIGLLIIIWIIVLLLHFVFTWFANYRAAVSPPASPFAKELNSLPPSPRLQASPRIDLKDLRVYEETELHKYKWVDRSKGIVTIPIDQAMQQIASKGIPPQKAPPSMKFFEPTAGTRMTGLEGKVGPEPR